MTASVLGWLFIVQGLVGLVVHLGWGFSATRYGYSLPIPGILMCVAQLWIGVGLLRARPAARWLSLGPCLLMVLGGFIVPAALLLAGAQIEVILMGLGMRSAPDWLVRARVLALFLTIYAIVSAVIAYTSYRYLRSDTGRMAYGAKTQEPGSLEPESFGVVVASAAIWLVVSWVAQNDVRLRAGSLPRFLQTSEMKAAQDANRAELLAEVAGRAYFTVDSRHVVFRPSTLAPEVLVLDLDTGKLRRTGVNAFTSSNDFHDPVSPDGASLVSGRKWYSLLDGDVREVKSLVHGSLGFHTPTRLLQYDSAEQKLELVDLASDSKLYSLAIPVAQRGEPSSDEPYNWTSFSQAWSEEHGLYAWMNRDQSLSVLDLATGRVEEFDCPYCRYGSAFRLSTSAATVFVPDPVSRGSGSNQYQHGGLLNIETGEWTPVRYQGNLAAFTEDGTGAAFSEHSQSALEFRRFDAGSRRWKLELTPEFSTPYAVSGGRTLVTQNAGGRRDQMFAPFESPEDGRPVRFVSFSSTLERTGSQPSPDGRYQLRADGARIEILDVEAALRDEPALRTMDLLNDDELSAPAKAVVTPGPTAYWTKIDSSEAQVPETLEADQDFEHQVRAATRDTSEASLPAFATSAPAVTANAEDISSPRPGGIAKCIDANGSVTFTQGPCPVGTRAVEAPTLDGAPSNPYLPRQNASSASRRPVNELNAAIGPDGDVQSMRTPATTCPGEPELKPFFTEMTIVRPGVSSKVIYVTRRNKVHESLEAARQDACAEARETNRR